MKGEITTSQPQITGLPAVLLNIKDRRQKLEIIAEFIRELIVQGTHEGLDAARARGARLGRPPAMTEEQVRHARDLLARPENTVTSIAKLLGVSRNTIYNYVPELKGGRLALAETTSTAALPRPSRAKD